MTKRTNAKGRGRRLGEWFPWAPFGAAMLALTSCASNGSFALKGAPGSLNEPERKTEMSAVQFAQRAAGERIPPAGTAGSMRTERFMRLVNQLSADKLGLLDELYAKGVRFEDPIRKIEGIEPLREHFARLYAGVADCKFIYGDVVESGDAAVIAWVMHMRHKTFRPKETLKLPGVSVLKFEGEHVVSHRDYFDLGAMLYERVTGLGFIVRKIKGRL